jgi:hypothetical protein
MALTQVRCFWLILSGSEKYAFARCELIGTFSTEELVFTIIELAYEPTMTLPRIW